MQSDATIPKSPAARSFLFAFFLMPAFAFVFPFIAERAPILKDLSESYSTHALDYAYTVSGEDADIVFFGDSTALYGPDMAELSHLLGMKAINLPETASTLPLLHERVLDRYLLHNKPPKLIVLHLAPWDLNFFEGVGLGLFDGEEQILRHDSLREIIQFARARPSEFMRFPFRFYFGSSRINWLWNHSYAPQEVTYGHGVVQSRFAPLSPTCRFPDKFSTYTRTDTVDQLMKKFRTRDTKVLLYLAPLPACGNLGAEQKMLPGRMHVEPSMILPANTFADDTMFAHPLRISSEIRTQAMAESIRKALAE